MIYGQCSYNNAQTTGNHLVVSAMSSMGNAGQRGGWSCTQCIQDYLWYQEGLAKLFGAYARQIAFTSNSTEKSEYCYKGILDPGDHVITTVLEHNSVLRPLYEMEKKGTELSVIGCNEKGMPDIATMEAAIKENTRMIMDRIFTTAIIRCGGNWEDGA